MRYFISFLSICVLPTFAMALGVNMNEAKTIKSDSIEYNVKTEEMKASGNTEITNASGQRIKSNSLTISKDKNSVSSNDIELWLGKHVYIRAKEITRDGVETVAKNAEFTACDECDDYGNAWEIFSKKVIHDSNEKMLYFHNASFWVYDNTFPILWLPYYEMPDPSVKYKTGFLNPSFNSTNDMGLQINIPFYINFSNTHDLTTTFSYLTKENPLFQAEHRLNLRHSEFRTRGSFTHNKEGENRWHIYNNDKIELGENARAYVYIARTSDKTYLQKYDFYDYQPYLDSGAKLELFGQTSYVVADTHIFQELRQARGNQHSISGNILPNIRGTYQTDPFFKETYLNLSSDILGVSGDDSNSQRLIGEARIISPWTLWFGNRVTASVAARYDIYNFDKTPIYENGQQQDSFSGVKSRFLPSGYVEWGLPLYSVKNTWTYIIEPRARLTIMQHTNKDSVFAVNNDSAGRFLSDTTLFSNNRFAGLDVWENGNFIDYGARWAAFNDNHNIEIFLGQTYDFNTDSTDKDFNDNGFRNGFSDYVGRIAYSRKYFQIASRFRFDREDLGLSHIENSLYFGKNGYYLTLGHIWDTQPIDVFSTTDKNTHEISAGGGIPLTDRFRIAGSVIYNAYEHLVQRRSAGIYYEHPCYHFSLEYSRDN
ncbi:MAG: LPS-assembly protein LptD, partial [Alphaproteobacteria bacterium]|nr:LPS-assembly protein LptD [Alphaproteobacteria bacterium]